MSTATHHLTKSTHYDGAVHYTPRITSLTDYYPFGAGMPGRGFSAGEYRFGFQGQEKDDELKGEGNSINCKYRMHYARIGRFFAVDPLAASFPWNSSYAFSENRVIDGVELEGLEYATFTILVVDGYTQAISVSTDYELKNEGSKGAGIQYTYIHLNSYTNTVTQTETFVNNMYGIYQGPDNPKLPKVGELWTKQEDYYDLEPIDETDANARQHDIDYDNAAPGGLKGFWGVLDARSSKANHDYSERAEKTIQKYKNGENDSVTKKPVTKEAAEAADFGRGSFRAVERLKNEPKEKVKL